MIYIIVLIMSFFKQLNTKLFSISTYNNKHVFTGCMATTNSNSPRMS